MNYREATTERLQQLASEEECPADIKRAAQAELSRRRQKEADKQREMRSIYDSLAWHLKDHLERADSIIRTMTHEMSVCGVPQHMYMPFMAERLQEMVAAIGAAAAEEGKTGC